MAHLSTHVLDTSLGRPAAGLQIRLSILEEGNSRHLKTAVTNADGRTDEPLLSGDRLTAGCYELIFGAGAYFRAIGVHLPDPPSSMKSSSASVSPTAFETATYPFCFRPTVTRPTGDPNDALDR